MKDTAGKLNIRYLGFESVDDGGRRLDFSITTAGRPPRRASFAIPAHVFSGTDRITFQESSAICYEKLRHMIDGDQEIHDALHFQLSGQDIEMFRPKRRRKSNV